MPTPSPAARSLSSLVLPVSELQAEFLYAADTVAERHGLTPARWQVLGAAIAQPQSVADIARGLGLARQSVQRVADDVVAAGLAGWAPNPAHARAKLLVATDAGHAINDAVTEDQLAWADEVGSRLDPHDVAALRGLLDRVTAVSREYWDELEAQA
ncbi:MarR family winged helix-turn-helix transcriptional regulator [Galactobacter valiniphilus]|uniref:MarR family winged helix-turn-helix transcriptional regulator n=1 Tax=Galactobacter valiniphilus TaxID=2676122 RepID=UPI003735F483